uniref:LigA n=1 Tax=Parastrongyloides trichosuri TaxID=131310 RepID=A0A0N4Z1E5_PARTI
MRWTAPSACLNAGAVPVGAGRGRRPGGGAERGRRRLSGQALRPRRTDRAGRGPVAPPRDGRGPDRAQGRRPGDEPDRPHRPPRGPGDRPAAARVPAAGVPDAPRRSGGDAHHAAGEGLGLPLRPADQRHRRPHQPPALQDRQGLRQSHAADRARRGVPAGGVRPQHETALALSTDALPADAAVSGAVRRALPLSADGAGSLGHYRQCLGIAVGPAQGRRAAVDCALGRLPPDRHGRGRPRAPSRRHRRGDDPVRRRTPVRRRGHRRHRSLSGAADPGPVGGDGHGAGAGRRRRAVDQPGRRARHGRSEPRGGGGAGGRPEDSRPDPPLRRRAGRTGRGAEWDAGPAGGLDGLDPPRGRRHRPRPADPAEPDEGQDGGRPDRRRGGADVGRGRSQRGAGRGGRPAEDLQHRAGHRPTAGGRGARAQGVRRR